MPHQPGALMLRSRIPCSCKFSRVLARPLATVPRIVLTHSTYCDDLIPTLRLMQTQSTDIRTIIPGRIRKCRGNVAQLNFHVTGQSQGGFRAVARKGSTAQEVFFRTALSKDELQMQISTVLRKQQKQGRGQAVNERSGHSRTRATSGRKHNSSIQNYYTNHDVFDTRVKSTNSPWLRE
jgi:hypothetical protein